MRAPVKQAFKAILENPDSSMDTAYVSIPFDVEKIYGTKGQSGKGEGTLDQRSKERRNAYQTA